MLETPSQRVEKQRRDWVRGKYARINDFIQETDWELEFEGLDLDDQVLKLNDTLHVLIDMYVPDARHDRPKHMRSNPPPQLLKRRKRAWERYMQVRRAQGRNSLQASIALNDFKITNWAVA